MLNIDGSLLLSSSNDLRAQYERGRLLKNALRIFVNFAKFTKIHVFSNLGA